MHFLGQHSLSLETFSQIVLGGESLQLEEESQREVETNFDFLKSYSQDKIIYGINTGLGPMAQYRISDADRTQLQYNLIRSHSAGAGPCFDDVLARATLLARLTSLMKAASGVHPSVVVLLKELLNHQVTVYIPEHGGVGASGDLVQLAHLALNLIGEGEMKKSGDWKPASVIFQETALTPMSIHIREGLAIMNGTSAMTGIAAVNIMEAEQLLNCSIILSAMTNEVMSSFDDHFSFELNAAKAHKGQSFVAECMRNILHDSHLTRHRPDHLYHAKTDQDFFTDKVQEYYSLRCVPQILGPAYDTMKEIHQTIENELNSVSDNPIIDHRLENVYHGGNFHGDYVALAMDKLKMVVTKMSMLAERQLNYLLNDKLNGQLPPFINLGKRGLNFGLQGLQFTATSTTAENQTLSFPMYLHSISNNNDNQDIVSMGCNAALITRKVISNSMEVLTIQLIAVLQAVDYLQCQGSLSSFTRKVYEEVRIFMPPITEDVPQYKRMDALKKYLVRLGSLKPASV